MRTRALIWLILALAVMAVSTTGQVLGLYADWLWFQEVQFTPVFVSVLQTQALLAVITGLVFFLILYGNLALAWRLAPREVLALGGEETLGLPRPELLAPHLRRLTRPGSLFVAALAGWFGTGRWEMVLRALYPTPFGGRDPLFDRDVAFYVLQLPLWNSLYGFCSASGPGTPWRRSGARLGRNRGAP